MKKYLILLFTSFSLSGCGTSALPDIFDDSVPVEYLLPATSFIGSETNGKLGSGKVIAGLAAGHSARLISDIDDVNYTTDPYVQNDIEWSAEFDIGIFKNLDLIFSNGVGLRLQLYGPSKREAKKGDYSLSIASVYLDITSEIEAEDETGGIKRAEAEIDAIGYKHMLVFGKRTTPHTLLYTNAFYAAAEVDKVELFQTNKTNYTITANEAKGHGETFGIGLGLLYDKPEVFFKKAGFVASAEVALSKSRWVREQSPKMDDDADWDAHMGAMVGFSW